MFKMAFDVDKLTSRINEMSDVMRNNVRPAAQAGAQVFYDEMKLRALTIGKSRQLQASIYQKFVVQTREEIGRAHV